MKIDWAAKLTSRKFWVTVCAFITNLVVAFGGAEQTAVQITGIIMAGAAVVAYILGEAWTDAAGVRADAETVSGYVAWEPKDKPPEDDPTEDDRK